MKKLINDPAHVLEEMVEGLALSDRRLALIEGETIIVRADYEELRKGGQVVIISGGGAGHEPAHAGYVGRGMLTAAVAGPVFTSPSVDAVLKAIMTIGGDGGVLLIVKNYTGDKLNFGLAAEIARTRGVAVEMVVVGDDVALGDGNVAVGRRGIAGTVFIHKVAGAAAEAGLTLGAVKAEAEAAAASLVSMGIGLSPCTVPAAGKPGFTLGDDEVEFGLGIHGESGVRRDHIAGADVMLGDLLDRLIRHGDFRKGARVALMVNGLGGTPALELSIAARAAMRRLSAEGIRVEAVMTGTFLSALEMAGCSLSLMRVDDLRLSRVMAPTEAGSWQLPATPPAGAQSIAAPAIDTMEADAGPAWPDGADRVRFAAAIRAVVGALRDAEQELTELDSAVGDGDLGISLARGADAVAANFDGLDLDHPGAALRQISHLLRRSLGGTSGPLYAVFVLRAANAIAGAADPASRSAWAAATHAGCDGIMRLGGAGAGDRTMLDALLPATSALGEQSVRAAVAAAQSGAEATRAMAPKRGRSSYLGDRTAGHPDPGAVAVAMWLAAIENVLGK